MYKTVGEGFQTLKPFSNSFWSCQVIYSNLLEMVQAQFILEFSAITEGTIFMIENKNLLRCCEIFTVLDVARSVNVTEITYK